MKSRYVHLASPADFKRRFPKLDRFHDGFVGPGLYNVASGFQMEQVQRADVCAPQVLRSMPEYVSHCSGKRITCRSQRLDDAARFDMVPWEPIAKRAPRKGYVSKKLCQAKGLRQSEADVEWLKHKHDTQMSVPSTDKLMAEVHKDMTITVNTSL